MRIYTLYDSEKRLRDAVSTSLPVAIKEGFSWPAFIFSALWALWHRLWIWAGVFFGAGILLGWVLSLAGAEPFVQSVASFALALIIGWTANDLRRRKLVKQGLEERAVLVAGSKETAITRYLMMQPVEEPPPTPMPWGTVA